MRAVGVTRHGGPEALAAVDVPEPEPREGGVRIRVTRTPVHPADVWLRQGGVARLMAGVPFPHVPGLELVGIAEMGSDRWAVGDRVAGVTTFVGTGRGAQAEVVVVDEADVVPVPDGLDDDVAATVLMNGLTALACLEVVPDDARRVAVVGAAGALGRLVVQLAVRRGLDVTGVARRGDEDLTTSFGARHATDLVGEPFDAVVDAAPAGAEALAAVVPRGTLVCVRPLDVPPERDGVDVRLVSVRRLMGDPVRSARLLDDVARGRLQVQPTTRTPWRDVVQAHRALERGGLRRRPVLDWTQQP